MEFFAPTLPQNDSASDKRSAELAAQQDRYRYTYEWPPEVATAAEVPLKDSYDALYMAALLPMTWDLFTNSIGLAQLVAQPEQLQALFDAEKRRALTLKPHEIGDWIFTLQTRIANQMSTAHAPSTEAFAKLYQTIGKTACYDVWDEDLTFTWQRLAGVNPMSLSRITELPDYVGIGEAHYARAIGGDDSLAAALDSGRLFAVDYTSLAGAPTGTTEGRKKCLPAPYALFASVGGALKTVAIQIGATTDSPTYAAGDGVSWRIAKLAFNAADANYHESIVHLGRTHMVMEAVTLATMRRLSSKHPLSLLLLPHCEYTMPINHSARTNLIFEGGVIDRCFGATIETTASLVRVGLDGLDLGKSAPPSDIARRGLDDYSVIAEFPYRDDGMLVWGAIRRHADRYVRTYYDGDADVSADVELATWVDELAAEDGGRIRGVPTVQTVDALVELIATIIWTGSAQHSAVNFTQFPYMGTIPNMVGALWDQWPVAGETDDEAKLLALLPPYNRAIEQFNTVYQLSTVRVNRLGHYPNLHFLHAPARSCESAFQKDLGEQEGIISAKDAERYLPYPHLLPSTIPASINI